MADGEQVGEGLYVKFGIDFSQMVGAGGAAAIVLNQTLQLFQQFENYGQQAFDATIGKAIEYQGVIEDLHNQLGLTNAEAQKWKSTLISVDTDIGSFSSALRYLTVRLSDSSAAGESLRSTLKSIGVDAKDATGNYKSASDVMQEVIVALDKIPAGTERANKAADIFGRNWYGIAELIDNGTEAVQRFKKEQPLFTDEELDRIDKAKNKIAEFNEKMDAGAAKIGSGIITNILEPIYNAGEIAGVEASALGMKFAGVREGISTGNWALFSEAQKRIMDPGAYTQEALSAQNANANSSGSSSSATKKDADLSKLLAQPQALQTKLDEITNVTLPMLKQAYIDAVNSGKSQADIDKAAKAYNDEIEQQETIKDKIRDQNLSYQEMIDITLPRLAEKLQTAKATGLKTDIEAAQIALDQGVNSANDLGEALGKAAINASSIKSSITIASGWSSKSVIGAAGSNMSMFMIDEMQHGASYQAALDAWAAGSHSYSSWTNGFGTLGAAIDAGITVTRNPGKNEREATAAAAKSGSSGAATPGTGTTGSSGTGDKTTTPTSPSEQAASETKLQQTELDKQIANVKTYLSDTQKAYLAGYLAIEKTDREHWTFLTEEMKTSLGNLTDNYKTWVKYVADNPTIMNIGVVMWTKQGADWDPMHNAEFMQTVRMSAMLSSSPEYASVDLSKIAFAGASSDKNNTAQVTVIVNNKSDGSSIDSAVAATSDNTAVSVLSQTGGTS